MRFLIAIYHPLDYRPELVEEDVMRAEIDALNEAMVAAGVRVFVGGLHPASSAKAVLPGQPPTEGPHLAAKEAIGGFWVLDVTDESAALDWAARAATACRVPVEVRRFHP